MLYYILSAFGMPVCHTLIEKMMLHYLNEK